MISSQSNLINILGGVLQTYRPFVSPYRLSSVKFLSISKIGMQENFVKKEIKYIELLQMDIFFHN